MKSRVLRVLVVLFLFPVLVQLFSLVVVLPVLLYNGLAGIEPVTQSHLVVSVAQVIIGVAGAIWATMKIWKRMGPRD